VQQSEHPGHKYFNINKKSMRKRAEEKFATDVLDNLEAEKAKFKQ